MAHIGIAGVTTEGALLCAREIATLAEQRLAPERRPEVTLHTHPMSSYLAALGRGDMDAVAELLLSSIGRLARAGAALAIIPANAPHFAFDRVAPHAPIPVLNLVDEVAHECSRLGYRRVGVLGVRWTMAGGLYTQPLRDRAIQPVVPEPADQDTLHSIITGELLNFVVRDESTTRLLAIVHRLRLDGCEAMILACTELPLCLSADNCGVPVIDTTRFLARRALDRVAPSGG